MSELVKRLLVAADKYEDEAGRDGRFALASKTLYAEAAERIAALEKVAEAAINPHNAYTSELEEALHAAGYLGEENE